MTRTFFFTVFLAGTAGQVSAEEIDCANAMAQQEMNICAEMDWQAADAALNTAYQETMAAMKEMDAAISPELQGAEEALRTAQRAWLEFRDAHCQTAGFMMRGGSAEPLLVYGCMRQVTEERTAQLRDLVNY